MFYGPTDRRATKVAVGIIASEGADAAPLKRWWSADADVRHSRAIGDAILAFIDEHAAKSANPDTVRVLRHVPRHDMDKAQQVQIGEFTSHGGKLLPNSSDWGSTC